MRAYRLSNNDVVIDIRPHASKERQLLRCTKVWCHKRESVCFKAIVTDKPIVHRLNPSETVVVHNQLSLAVTKGLGADSEKSWFDEVRELFS